MKQRKGIGPRRTSYKEEFGLSQPTGWAKIAKKLARASKHQLCPKFRALGKFSWKIKIARDDKEGKDTMMLKSDFQKYVHKHLNLSHVHELA